jgi:hypothetical protein
MHERTRSFPRSHIIVFFMYGTSRSKLLTPATTEHTVTAHSLCACVQSKRN